MFDFSMSWTFNIDNNEQLGTYHIQKGEDNLYFAFLRLQTLQLMWPERETLYFLSNFLLYNE